MPIQHLKITQQQFKNLKYAAEVLWPNIKPEQVQRGLAMWTCGTQACFGGWVTRDPYFQAQGVSTHPEGDPRITHLEDCCGPDVAAQLFGAAFLFHAVPTAVHSPDLSAAYQDSAQLTAHELVTARLAWMLEHAQVEESAQ